MTIGILGGGQLGRMIALAGIPLGLTFRFLDPAGDAPAAAVGELHVGRFDDPVAIRRFAKGLDLATFEFENVPVGALSRLTAAGVAVYPSTSALGTAQDRLLEKQMFERVGLRVPPYAPIDSQEELEAAVKAISLPAVLKTRRLGYDGKGQRVLRRWSDVRGAVAVLAPEAAKRRAPAGLILERFVPFECEASIIAVAGRDGSFAAYPLTQNVHRAGILRTSRVPASGIAPQIERRALSAVRRLVKQLEYVGVLAVEFFVHDGQLLANEMAPRVHNSGHWTIDGAITSQFENHLRAILGWPLGPTAARGPCIMHNLIGDAPAASELAAVPGACVHLYGKEPRPGRKVGHVTCLPSAASDADASVEVASRRVARLIRAYAS